MQNYTELSDKFNLNEIYKVDINTYTQLLKDIEYVDPDDDYNSFCKNNKINENKDHLANF